MERPPEDKKGPPKKFKGPSKRGQPSSSKSHPNEGTTHQATSNIGRKKTAKSTDPAKEKGSHKVIGSGAVQSFPATGGGSGTVTPPPQNNTTNHLKPIIRIGRAIPFNPEKYNVVIPTRGILEERLIHDNIVKKLEDKFKESIDNDDYDYSNVFSSHTKDGKRQVIFPQTIRAIPNENDIPLPIIDKGEDKLNYYYHLTSGALHIDELDSDNLTIPTNIHHHLKKSLNMFSFPIEMDISIPEDANSDAEERLKKALKKLGYNPVVIWPDGTPNVKKTAAQGTKINFETDGPTMNDFLGFKPVVQGLSEFLKNDDTHLPLSIAIDGPWGTGKSSLMKMLREELDPGVSEAEEKLEKSKSFMLTAWQHFRLFLFAMSPIVFIILFAVAIFSYQINQPTIAFPTLSAVIATIIFSCKHWIQSQLSNRKTIDRSYETVFINAWRHGHGSRLTATIVHEVIKNLTRRHGPIFMLELHLSRLNSWTLMQSATNAFFRSNIIVSLIILLGIIIWTDGAFSTIELLPVLSDDLKTMLNSAEFDIEIFKTFGGITIALGTIGLKIISKPNEVDISDFITSPNYEKHVGPDQEIEEDFRHVLDLLEKKNKKLALFIDDLDRCTPDTVHKVVEALNVFFGREGNQCLFILGMHREMVASSLEVAYEKLAKQIDGNSLLHEQKPFGRRFLEKIVQFIVHVPEPTADDLKEYLDFLTSNEEKPSIKALADLQERLGKLKSHPLLKFFNQKLPNLLELLSNIGLNPFVVSLSNINKYETIISNSDHSDEDVEIFRQKTQDNEAKREVLLDRAKKFSEGSKENKIAFELVRPVLKGNPRQYKRFFNHMRFNRFLSLDKEERPESESITEDAILAAIALEFPSFHYWMVKERKNIQGLIDKHAEIRKINGNTFNAKQKKETDFFIKDLHENLRSNRNLETLISIAKQN